MKSNQTAFSWIISLIYNCIPGIHISPNETDTIVPFVISNLSATSIFLPRCKILGFLDQTDTEICEVMTSSVLEPLAAEVTSKQCENPLPYRKGQFICSPADTLVHRKVDL